MRITITGFPGSGKSTLGRGIAESLGLKHYSAGDFWRQIGKERGLSLMQIQELAKKDASIDEEVDKRTEELGRKEENFVMDGRLAWYFIPESIKIFVKIDLGIAAQRVFQDIKEGKKERSQETENKSLEQTMQNMEKRMQLDRKRWLRLYNVDYLDEKNYDIIVDTSKTGIPETRERVLKQIKQYLSGSKKGTGNKQAK